MIAAGKGGTTKRLLTQKERGWKYVKEFPFDPSRKRASVVYRVGKKHHSLAKGTKGGSGSRRVASGKTEGEWRSADNSQQGEAIRDVAGRREERKSEC
jgi:magnesium-transporting ATPase (P-type)